MPKVIVLTGTGTAQRRLLKETVGRLQQEGYEELVRKEGGDWLSLFTENLSIGLFGEKRLVLIEDAESLGRFPVQYIALIENTSCSALLLAYTSEPSKWIEKAVLARCEVVKSKGDVPKPWERSRWIERKARDAGLSLTAEAVMLLAERIADPEELSNELVKLALVFHKDNPLTPVDIMQYCTADGSGEVLRLLDGLCCNNFDDCFSELSVFRMNRADFIPILTAVYNRMRLAWYAARCPSHRADMAKGLDTRDYAWKQACKAASIYGKEALGAFVTRCLLMNINERLGRSSGWMPLESAVLSLLEVGNNKEQQKK